MSKESDAIRKEIAALEAQLQGEKPRRQARKQTSKEELLGEIRALEAMVNQACGESYMDDDDESEMGYMDDDMEMDVVDEEVDFMDDDESEMMYMDDEDMDDEDMDDESEMMYMDDDLDDDLDVLEEDEEDIVYASEEEDDIEDEITQDSLDDVLEEEKDPSSIVTNPSMLDTAPTGYVARLKSASARLDKVANYLEKQGNKKMALRIDTIADAIDARIKKEARNA